MADRQGSFTTGSATLTFGEDFYVENQQQSGRNETKLFRSNSVSWKNGRRPIIKRIRGVWKSFTGASKQKQIETWTKGILDNYLDEEGTILIDSTSVTGTWILTAVSNVKITGSETLPTSADFVAEIDLTFKKP